MTESLRPMNLGGILDRGVQVFRARYLVFFGLASITGIAQLAFRLASVHPKSGSVNGGFVFASYAATFVMWVASVYLGVIVSAAICLAASRVNLGEEVTVHEAFASFTSKFWRLFGLGLMQAIYAGWPMIIAVVVAVIVGALVTSGGTSSASVGVAVVIVYVLGGVACLILYTQFALAYPATAIEGLTASSAIARSENLAEGGRRRIFWGIVVPSVPSYGLVFGVSSLLGALKNGNALLASNPLLVAGIDGVVGLIAALIFTPYASIVLTLLYYDQRIRREGFDVERMMQVAGLDPNVPLPAIDGTPITADSEASQ